MYSSSTRYAIAALLLLNFAACSDDDSSTDPGPGAADASELDSATGPTDSASTDTADSSPADEDTVQTEPLVTTVTLEGEAWPESVEFDPETRAFFVTSLELGSVIRVDGVTGEQTEFYAGNGSEWLALGMAIDESRRRLWVCTVFTKEISRGEVLAIDLDSGELQSRIDLEDAARGGACTDFALASDGSVYVTDREAPRIYHVDLEAEPALELAIEDPVLEPEFVGQNGIVLSEDETTLISGKYLPAKLIRVDLDAEGGPVATDLEVDFGDLTGGADDMVMLDGRLTIVMEDRVAEVELNADWSEAEVTSQYPISENADGSLLGGYSGIIAAEGDIYVSRSDVVLFALGLEPSANFLIQKVDRP